VRDVQYESNPQAYERFLRLFQNNRDLVDNVKPEALPASFRFLLTDRPAAAAALKELGAHPCGVLRR
jgi:cell division transport system permease protein